MIGVVALLGLTLLRYEASHVAMGCTYKIVVYAPSEQIAREVTEQAFEEVDRLDALLSNYKKDSELSDVNRRASKGPVKVTPEFFRFVQASDDYRRQTWGAFDITLGKGRLALDPQNYTVEFTDRAVQLDPGGIGKGWAVDRAVAILKEAGIRSALVDSGMSTIYAIGTPPDAPRGQEGWKVTVRSPRSKDEAMLTVLLKDNSLSTSATYEKGEHIVDPRTHRPPTGITTSVSFAPTGTESDALSTAFFVLKREGASKYLRLHPANRAFLCDPDCSWVK